MEDYPEPVLWYELILVEVRGKDGLLQHRAVSLGNKIIINAMLDRDEQKDDSYSTNTEDAAIVLCSLITQAAKESMSKIRNGTYNDLVKESLPHQFRIGVIKKSVVWERDPEWREHVPWVIRPVVMKNVIFPLSNNTFFMQMEEMKD